MVATDVFGLVVRVFGIGEDRLREVITAVLFVFAVPHEDNEAMLSVSAVRTEEGVFKIRVALFKFLEPNGEGGGVNSLKLTEDKIWRNCGLRAGDDDDSAEIPLS